MNRRTFIAGAATAGASFNATRSEATKGEIVASQYVIVELMGYKKLAGRLSQGIGGLLQLDVPVEGGSIVQFINPQSVYRITIVDEAAVLEAAKHLDTVPVIELEIPPGQMSLRYSGYVGDGEDRWHD